MESLATGSNPARFAVISTDAVTTLSCLLHADVRIGHCIGLFIGLSVNDIDIPASLGLDLLLTVLLKRGVVRLLRQNAFSGLFLVFRKFEIDVTE